MALICAVVPVRPGQEERVRRFRDEMGDEGRGRYEELNRRAGISRHAIWLQQLPSGWVSVNLFEVDDPSRFPRQFDESDPFDRWWLEFVREVHGLDLQAVSVVPAPPGPTYLWEDTGASQPGA
jgi:hypothetical protein